MAIDVDNICLYYEFFVYDNFFNLKPYKLI